MHQEGEDIHLPEEQDQHPGIAQDQTLVKDQMLVLRVGDKEAEHKAIQNQKTYLLLNNLPLNQLPLTLPQQMNHPRLDQHLLTLQNQHLPQILRIVQGHQHQIGLALLLNLIFNKQENMRGESMKKKEQGITTLTSDNGTEIQKYQWNL
jgi:hypothetical protein